MRVLIAALLVVFVFAGVPGGAALAQERIEVAQARTLFDLLFGPKETTPPPATTRTQPRAPRPPPATPHVVVQEIIDKNENATRLAVFGDSMAVDLARALERAYVEDPNLAVLDLAVGSSGFVRDDFFDWNAALAEQIKADSFDLAVIIIGINDRQPIGTLAPLSDEWKTAYLQRLNDFLAQLRLANKPAIWVGLPPMRAPTYSAAISQISSLHRLASVSVGVEFVDIYERFTGEDGRFSATGPDLDGQQVSMRKRDGIHFSSAGSDKIVFFLKQALRRYYRGGTVRVKIADLLDGTDAQTMIRLPFQGTGQVRLLEVAGAVITISDQPGRADTLVLNEPGQQKQSQFKLSQLVNAPQGRADEFGVGITPKNPDADNEDMAPPVEQITAGGEPKPQTFNAAGR